MNVCYQFDYCAGVEDICFSLHGHNVDIDTKEQKEGWGNEPVSVTPPPYYALIFLIYIGEL